MSAPLGNADQFLAKASLPPAGQGIVLSARDALPSKSLNAASMPCSTRRSLSRLKRSNSSQLTLKHISDKSKPEFLSGWKDIANHLGKDVRTVQRYERELGLPIRRPAGKPRGSVVAAGKSR